jgi:hypothetical protein
MYLYVKCNSLHSYFTQMHTLAIQSRLEITALHTLQIATMYVSNLKVWQDRLSSAP